MCGFIFIFYFMLAQVVDQFCNIFGADFFFGMKQGKCRKWLHETSKAVWKIMCFVSNSV